MATLPMVTMNEMGLNDLGSNHSESSQCFPTTAADVQQCIVVVFFLGWFGFCFISLLSLFLMNWMRELFSSFLMMLVYANSPTQGSSGCQLL